MTHEFKNIIQGFQNAKHIGLKSVMATVVALDGSSYRRPGVRMLINENGQMTGAVSGGCVEKEILRQADTVFKTGKSKMMTYDGRYKLGCEGTLYILIEYFDPSSKMLSAFETCLKDRTNFKIHSYFNKEIRTDENLGSEIYFSKNERFSLSKNKRSLKDYKDFEVFSQALEPCFKLIIIGAEHDAAQLCLMGSSLGWEVDIVISPSNPQTLKDFPGAHQLIHQSAENLSFSKINKNVAFVLMTHSYVKDLQYLITLKDLKPAYIGLLGPSNRRERMLNDLIERFPLLDDSFFDFVYGPAGLNIGAETPQEIALSICSEILSVIRNQQPKSLKNKMGSIHMNINA